MTLSDTISTRYRRSGGRDPDTLHGLLFITERGAETVKIAPLMHSRPEKISALLERAREGHAGRVPHDQSERGDDIPLDDPDGLYPSKWRRALIAMMLRPDGATNLEFSDFLEANGASHDVTYAVQILRSDLKVNGISFGLERVGSQFRYRIVGRNNWRMQKIIANGWAL